MSRRALQTESAMPAKLGLAFPLQLILRNLLFMQWMA